MKTELMTTKFKISHENQGNKVLYIVEFTIHFLLFFALLFPDIHETQSVPFSLLTEMLVKETRDAIKTYY